MVIGILVMAKVMLVDVGGICCDKKVVVPMLVMQIIAGKVQAPGSQYQASVRYPFVVSSVY